MRWFHVIDADEVMSPRTGIVVEKDRGKVVAVHLIVAIAGRTPRLMFEDYRNGVVLGLPRFWCRAAAVRMGSGRWRPVFVRGVDLAPRLRDKRWRLIPRD